MASSAPLAVYTDVDDLDPTPGVQALQDAGFRVRVLETRDEQTILDAAADATALLVGYAPIPASLLARLPQLRIIALLSRGHDNVDADAATDRGVWVTNLDDLSSDEVADHTWALAAALLRDLPFHAAAARRGDWLARRTPAPRRLSTVAVGVLGLGRIGRKVAARAVGQVAEVLGHDPWLPEDVEIPGVRRVSLPELQARSDLITLHLPLSDGSQALVDAGFLAAMRPGSLLVNTSRGGLVDPVALAAALDDGRLAGAALDVLDVEPPPADHPLLHRDDVLITPHIAYLSDVTRRSYITEQAANVLTWARTGRPNSPVNAPEPPGADR
ncbi:C-terminal binding protein [Nakamurella leprariae]|uniref:C-terminal binding protein n=1 Tax=Nakamurella leprariae TaxID=2803911 RepID=A0A939BYG2_9ACTN|nr:C-terminal binding protein [Nakamurella leprariae]MBM9469523.1 C-terminal binding protein [Nakamurella leprariae]